MTQKQRDEAVADETPKGKRPAFQFYPADWRKDPELRVCSLAARGLWIDMIAIMHEADPYGHLMVSGNALTPVDLSRLVGDSASTVKRLLGELERNKVFSRTDAGVIYSRRMVRDEYIRQVRAAAGKNGGNPNLKKSEDLVGDLDKQNGKQKPTPSSSSSSSSAPSVSSEQRAKEPPAEGEDNLKAPPLALVRPESAPLAPSSAAESRLQPPPAPPTNGTEAVA